MRYESGDCKKKNAALLYEAQHSFATHSLHSACTHNHKHSRASQIDSRTAASGFFSTDQVVGYLMRKPWPIFESTRAVFPGGIQTGECFSSHNPKKIFCVCGSDVHIALLSHPPNCLASSPWHRSDGSTGWLAGTLLWQRGGGCM